MSLFGGIEAGGTKFVCAIGSGPDDIRKQERFPTTTPQETLQRAADFFLDFTEKVSAVGISAFGPVDPDPTSKTYGSITSTPKPGWQNTDVTGPIGRALGVPVAFDTDVNGAALGEHIWGAAQGLHTFIYMTIGTGIGGGGMLNGQLMHGLVHPEMGHVLIPHDLEKDPFPGSCPFHGDCFEGLANGPAIEKRWGVPGENLPPDHPAWQLEAEYLAYGVVDTIMFLSPQRIILGGGVMEQRHLFPLLRRRVLEMLNGYVKSDTILKHIDDYIVPPALGGQAGVLGSIALARRMLEER